MRGILFKILEILKSFLPLKRFHSQVFRKQQKYVRIKTNILQDLKIATTHAFQVGLSTLKKNARTLEGQASACSYVLFF